MTEETPGQKMAKNARRLYDEGVVATKAWHDKLKWPENRPLGKSKGDHERGAVSPLGGDGWWSNAS